MQTNGILSMGLKTQLKENIISISQSISQSNFIYIALWRQANVTQSAPYNKEREKK